MRYSLESVKVFVVLCVGMGIRAIVSLSSYSGAKTAPMFGDYEAQRHWQEITYNLPASSWYINTTDNDLLYWGIDYPPLTAYHSFFLGMIANRINSSYVALFHSRGFESVYHKSFMRITVLAADLFVYIPAVALAVFSLKPTTPKYILPSLMLLLFYPCQILIDNGHFQYNNISLGLFLFSVASIIRNRYIFASIAFSLALNYKQMELYHALPIFVYLLNASFSRKSILKNILSLVEVGLTTLATFILIWLPWISSTDSLKAVALRLFPLNRGVFEDKVANVWCSLNVVYKLKENLRNDQMALVCLGATLISIIPTNLHLYFNPKRQTFLYALANTSLSFFLLSFQVHEKTILLAAIPICFLFQMMPFSVVCFLKISTFSIFPLVIKDNLRIAYFCMFISYLIIFKSFIQLAYSKDKAIQLKLERMMDLFDVIIITTSSAALLIPSPDKLPFLWPFVISFFCCIIFIIFLMESNLVQLHNSLMSNKYFNTYFFRRIY